MAARICAQLPRLTALSLRCCHAPLLGAQRLCHEAAAARLRLAALGSLTLGACKLADADVAALVAAAPQLQSICLDGVTLQPHALAALAPLRPTLQRLALTHMPRAQMALQLQPLAALSKLSHLTLSDLQAEPLSAAAAAAAAGVPPGAAAEPPAPRTATPQQLIERHEAAIAASLAALSNLQHLELRRIKVSTGTPHLAPARACLVHVLMSLHGRSRQAGFPYTLQS
jgi:hypothetical protein